MPLRTTICIMASFTTLETSNLVERTMEFAATTTAGVWTTSIHIFAFQKGNCGDIIATGKIRIATI